MSNKSHEGIIFRTKEGKITARFFAPMCVDNSIILTNETGVMHRSIDASNTHLKMLKFKGVLLNFKKGYYFHVYRTTNKPLILIINQEQVKIKN